MEPTFFATPARFRAWLKKHHKTADEVIVGFYRKDSGKPSITWQQAVDEVLCVRWSLRRLDKLINACESGSADRP
jgi:uncharacterized protein YdeI (YjbR/CyaY-like superfamily)